MNNKIVTSIILLIGTAGGAFAGYMYGRKKYIAFADNEIKRIEEYYKGKRAESDYNSKEYYHYSDGVLVAQESEETKVDTTEKKNVADTETKKEYAEKIKQYTSAAVTQYKPDNVKLSKKSVKALKENKPYLITEDEYAESDYNSKGYYYYSDGVLIDQESEDIVELRDLLGEEKLTFGVPGNNCKDALYYRDDTNKVDLEILYIDKEYYREDEKQDIL